MFEHEKYKSIKQLTDEWSYKKQEQYVEHLNQIHQLRISYKDSQCIFKEGPTICNCEGCWSCSIYLKLKNKNE